MTAENHDRPTPPVLRFTDVTLAAAVAAPLVARASLALAPPVSAMFIGEEAFFTRGYSARQGLTHYLRLVFVQAFGILSSIMIGSHVRIVGGGTLPLIVLVIATIVVSLRAIPIVNNISGYFLGFVRIFATHVQPTLYAFAEFGTAGALGSFAGWLASRLKGRAEVL